MFWFLFGNIDFTEEKLIIGEMDGVGIIVKKWQRKTKKGQMNDY